MKNHFIIPLFFLFISLNVFGQKTMDSIPEVVRNAIYQISGGIPCNLTLHEHNKYAASFYYNYTKNLMAPGLRALKTRFSNPGPELLQKFADSIPYVVVNDSSTGYKIAKGIKLFHEESDSLAYCEVTVSSYNITEIRIDASGFVLFANPQGGLYSVSYYTGALFPLTHRFDYDGNYLSETDCNGMEYRTILHSYNNPVTRKKASTPYNWMPLKIKNYLLKNYPKCSFGLNRIMTKKNEVKEIHLEAYKKGERATLVFDNNANLIRQTEFEKLPVHRGWR